MSELLTRPTFQPPTARYRPIPPLPAFLCPLLSIPILLCFIPSLTFIILAFRPFPIRHLNYAKPIQCPQNGESQSYTLKGVEYRQKIGYGQNFGIFSFYLYLQGYRSFNLMKRLFCSFLGSLSFPIIMHSFLLFTFVNVYKQAMDTEQGKFSAEGIIFVYNCHGSVAYKTNIKSNNYLIFLDGMTGNLLSIPYFHHLKSYCNRKNLVLVYPQLRSHPDFFVHAIEEDIEDITALVDRLKGNVVLLGHSTGCQDSLLYFQASKCDKIKGIILQAPVSDIESKEDPSLHESVSKAKQSGKYFIEDEQVWLSERFITVNEERNKEDLFSSYLPDQQFEKWKQLPILSVLSLKDEYCKKDLREKFKLMGKVEVLENANHAITREEDQLRFIAIIDGFLKEIHFVL